MATAAGTVLTQLEPLRIISLVLGCSVKMTALQFSAGHLDDDSVRLFHDILKSSPGLIARKQRP